MKLVIITALSTLLLLGCSRTSEIKVYNDTDSSINVSLNDTSQLLFAGQMVEEEFAINHFVLFSETLDVPLHYDESLYVSGRNKAVRLKANETKKIHITFDRAGMQVRNISSNVGVMDVYIQNPDTGKLSDNLLESVISPNHIELISVPEKSGYVVITDVFGAQYTSAAILENEVGITKEVSFDGFEVVVLE